MEEAGADFLKNEEGAIAPLYALVLTALIAVGGIAFDYSRLAAMDTELQNAADQAALAAASQLDGQGGAILRATSAANNLVANETRFANDGNVAGRNVTIANITFLSCESDDCRADRTRANMTELPGTADDDAIARFVEVTVGGRQAFYALTPIVNAFSSGNIDATALAGLGSAVCRVPPVMFCNPNEPTTGPTGGDFYADLYAGAGIRLISGDTNFPGNFGFLDNGSVTNNANSTPDLARALGHDTPPGNCTSIDDVGLRPGQREVVFNALNTRFDINTNGANTCPSGDICSSAQNSRKDVVRRNQCGINNNGWNESANPYRPTLLTPLTGGFPDIMGHPRDICHAISFDGSCDGNGDGITGDMLGNKLWDRDAYFRVNYGHTTRAAWQSATGLGNDATRYDVYQWELENPPASTQSVGGGRNGHNSPVCLPPAPATIPDRRRVAAAVVNCREQAARGNDTVRVLKWVDLFLVEPSFNRFRGSGPTRTRVTADDQVYVEVIGETRFAGGGPDNQIIRRDVPYLIE